MSETQRAPSPIEEYDRQQAERSRRAVSLLRKLVIYWFICHLAVIVSVAVGITVFGSRYSDNDTATDAAFTGLLLGISLMAGLISLATGLVALMTTFWRWNLLNGAWRLAGLVPWLVILGEFTFLVMVMMD